MRAWAVPRGTRELGIPWDVLFPPANIGSPMHYSAYRGVFGNRLSRPSLVSLVPLYKGQKALFYGCFGSLVPLVGSLPGTRFSPPRIPFLSHVAREAP